jgi:glycosyltransferase involved in cell wall biosynthesis
MTRKELAMVMPVYNEEGAIGNVVRKWTAELQRLNINFQIHTYNDGSKDRTLNILREIAADNKRLVVHDKPNSGHGPTVLLGYRENSHAEWIFQIDSDDEIGPEKFGELWKNRDRYDFLIGSRVLAEQPLVRRLVSSISRLTVRLFYGSMIFDVNSPYRLMRSSVFKDIFYSLPEGLFAPNVIISGIVSLKNLRAYEIPVQYKPRVTGEVSLKKIKLFKAAAKSFYQTIACRFRITKDL